MQPESPYRAPRAHLGIAEDHGFRILAVIAGLVTLWLIFWLMLMMFIAVDSSGQAAGLLFLACSLGACVAGGFVAGTIAGRHFELHAASVGLVSSLPLLLLGLLGSPRWGPLKPWEVAWGVFVMVAIPVVPTLLGGGIARWRERSARG